MYELIRMDVLHVVAAFLIRYVFALGLKGHYQSRDSISLSTHFSWGGMLVDN